MTHRPLFGFLVNSFFAAELAVLLQFKPVGIVLLVFHSVVISLFALSAFERKFNAHISPRFCHNGVRNGFPARLFRLISRRFSPFFGHTLKTAFAFPARQLNHISIHQVTVSIGKT
jgi:hypothetical protein